MAERHDLDESIFRKPLALFHHVIEHHGDLRDWPTDINEAKEEEIQKHLSPRGHLMI